MYLQGGSYLPNYKGRRDSKKFTKVMKIFRPFSAFILNKTFNKLLEAIISLHGATFMYKKLKVRKERGLHSVHAFSQHHITRCRW